MHTTGERVVGVPLVGAYDTARQLYTTRRCTPHRWELGQTLCGDRRSVSWDDTVRHDSPDRRGESEGIARRTPQASTRGRLAGARKRKTERTEIPRADVRFRLVLPGLARGVDPTVTME